MIEGKWVEFSSHISNSRPALADSKVVRRPQGITANVSARKTPIMKFPGNDTRENALCCLLATPRQIIVSGYPVYSGTSKLHKPFANHDEKHLAGGDSCREPNAVPSRRDGGRRPCGLAVTRWGSDVNHSRHRNAASSDSRQAASRGLPCRLHAGGRSGSRSRYRDGSGGGRVPAPRRDLADHR